MRWEHAYHLFLLGAFAFLSAFIGRTARRRRTHGWKPLHIVSMGSSYVLMLIAFYVDNGKQLPPLNQLPPWTYWAFPIFIAVPIIIWALVRHSVARQAQA
jgi:lipopolysaccharide export LptBFGC system permease protein LptF